MTKRIVEQYEKLLAEFSLDDEFGRTEREGLRAFLANPETTPEKIEQYVAWYNGSMSNGSSLAELAQNREYRWATYLAEFERKGTIRGTLSNEDVIAMVKAIRKQR